MYCRKCHRHSDFRANFCRFCGAPLGTVENCGLQPPLKEYETFFSAKKWERSKSGVLSWTPSEYLSLFGPFTPSERTGMWEPQPMLLSRRQVWANLHRP